MKLHGYWRSSCSYRVRIALGLKGLVYENVAVNLLEGAQADPGFTSRYAMAQVPVLEDEGATLAQSVAILEYLEERFPTPALLPADRVLRARCRELTEIVNSGIQPLQNLLVIRQLKDAGVDTRAWCASHIRRGLSAYSVQAARVAGEFSVGDAPSFADCALIPQLFNARRFDIDVEAELPRLAAIEARCLALEAFRSAHPDAQPDALPA